MNDATLIALGLHYENLAAELRAEMLRTLEQDATATRQDMIADIAKRFTFMTDEEAPALVVVVVDSMDASVTIVDDTRPCPECEVGTMTLDDHEWVCCECCYGEDESDPSQVLQCPHCHGVDVKVRRVETAQRWSVAKLEVEGTELIPCHETGQGDFRHSRYECTNCDKRVGLPSGLT